MRWLVITLTAFVAANFAGTAGAEEAPNRSKELQVLDRFVGTWDIRVSVTRPGNKVTTSDAISIRKWSKGGKFVVFDDPQEEELLFTGEVVAELEAKQSRHEE